MIQLNNSKVAEELIDVAKAQSSVFKKPFNVSPVVIPTIEVNPKSNRVSNHAVRLSKATTGSTTIYTVPANKDYYITALGIAIAKDAASTSVASSISASINGITVNLIDLAGLTGTAQVDHINLSLKQPLKVDSGTNIVAGNGAAITNGFFSVIGILVDNGY